MTTTKKVLAVSFLFGDKWSTSLSFYLLFKEHPLNEPGFAPVPHNEGMLARNGDAHTHRQDEKWGKGQPDRPEKEELHPVAGGQGIPQNIQQMRGLRVNHGERRAE